MPATNKIIDLFLGEEVQQIKSISARANPEDVTIVQNVFPEAGVTSYLSGLIFKLLADSLREHDIENVGDRHKIDSFKTLESLKASIQIIITHDEPN